MQRRGQRLQDLGTEAKEAVELTSQVDSIPQVLQAGVHLSNSASSLAGMAMDDLAHLERASGTDAAPVTRGRVSWPLHATAALSTFPDHRPWSLMISRTSCSSISLFSSLLTVSMASRIDTISFEKWVALAS